MARTWTPLAHLCLLIVLSWHLILDILRRLDAHLQPATLVMPNWPCAHWWSSLLASTCVPPVELPIEDDDGHPLLHHTTLMVWNLGPDVANAAPLSI